MNGRSLAVSVSVLAVTTVLSAQNADGTRAQTPAAAGTAAPTQRRTTEVGWNLAAADQRYASIDGAHLKQYVSDLTAISRRYRDNGHPQYWGRIIGTEADTENAQWLMGKFKEIGLSDVHEQSFDLPPQWMPHSWSVVLSANGKTFSVDTAQPTYQGVGTPPAGIDLEAEYVGMASDADLKLAPDVKGKAVFFYSTDTGSRHAPIADNAIRRLGERGAAAIFVIQGIPGNERTQFYPVNSQVPTFSTGLRDGLAARDFIADASGGASKPRVKITLPVDRVPGLKTGTVWGTLPGATDEQVVIVAHRDGWFEGANDNATGVATLVGLAEYFAKIPKSARHRTIVFLGTTGHHNSSAESGTYFAAHPELFAKTALLINCEHTGPFETGVGSTRLSNEAAAMTWFASDAALAQVAVRAMDAFGVATYPNSAASPAGEIGRYFRFAPSVQLLSDGYVWHSDQETAETISATGLGAVARTYAKIIVDTDTIDLAKMRQSVQPAPAAAGAAAGRGQR